MLHSRLRPLPRRKFHKPIQTHHCTNDSTSAIHKKLHIGFDIVEDESEDNDEDAEDIFTAFLPHLFPEDAPPFHGDPGQCLLYDSPHFGPLKIMVPSYPGQSEKRIEGIAAGLLEIGLGKIDLAHEEEELERLLPGSPEGGTDMKAVVINKVDEERKLFAHLLWSASMVVAHILEDAATVAAASRASAPDSMSSATSSSSYCHHLSEVAINRQTWDVRDHTILELGAGAGLPSIISVLASAAHVTITDHPSSSAFTGAIDYNIIANIPASEHYRVTAQPHEWGTLSDAFAISNKGRFSRIIAADCFWMKNQHENLVSTMLWFLSGDQDTSHASHRNSEAEKGKGQERLMADRNDREISEGKILIVAGFHTGRAIVASFFNTAVGMGLEIEDIFERDLSALEEDGEVRRPWTPVREGEGPENRRRWCVIAVLRRKKL